MSAAQSIAEELRAICGRDRLVEFAHDDCDSLEAHKSLVKVRIGGDFSEAAWDVAMHEIENEYYDDSAPERHARSRYSPDLKNVKHVPTPVEGAAVFESDFECGHCGEEHSTEELARTGGDCPKRTK